MQVLKQDTLKNIAGAGGLDLGSKPRRLLVEIAGQSYYLTLNPITGAVVGKELAK